MSEKIIIKRPKERNKSQQELYDENFEKWVSYWRANPHRFITDYLGLTLYDFQKVLIYQMNMYPNFIFVASNWCCFAEMQNWDSVNPYIWGV